MKFQHIVFFFFNESISDFQFLFCTAKHSLILGHRKIEDHCGGLSETGPHRLIYVKAWSPVGRTVLERIRRYGIFKGNFEVSTAHDVANLIFSLPFLYLLIRYKLPATAPVLCLSGCCHVSSHDGHRLTV